MKEDSSIPGLFNKISTHEPYFVNLSGSHVPWWAAPLENELYHEIKYLNYTSWNTRLGYTSQKLWQAKSAYDKNMFENKSSCNDTLIHMHLSIYNQTLQKLQSIEILISTAYLNDRNYGEEENTW